ncbi:hypothetical protein QE152_g38379 [Popillia japonica]|uniref:MARVEL domain-containing protein n=1 Tax=Popillia japonica TaxID=7064 RepID=A0AAW1HYI8_POPJA
MCCAHTLPYFNVLCWKRNRARGPCNEIRVLELILCIVSFGLSYYFSATGILPVPIFLILFCMLGIIFILIVDIIVISAWYPIGWRAWILISLSSALYYFACTGLSFLIVHKHYIMGSIFYCITAIVFLLDGLCIIWLVRRTGDTVSRTCPSTCKSSQVLPMNRPVQLIVARPSVSTYAGSIRIAPQTISPSASSRQMQPSCGERASVYSTQRSTRVSYCKRMPSAVYSSRSIGDVAKPDSPCACSNKMVAPPLYSNSSLRSLTRTQSSFNRQAPAVTHGGTFHVSKDVLPMPSVQPTKSISEPDLSDSFEIGDSPRKNSRSVAIMIKMYPPHKQHEVDLTPLKSPFAPEPYDRPRKPPKIDRVKSVQ